MTSKDDDPTPIALDALDQVVLRTLRREPRASYAEVAAATGAHERTVARRVERMLGTGRIRFTASLLHEYIGTGVAAQLASGAPPVTSTTPPAPSPVVPIPTRSRSQPARPRSSSS
ncbi:Lrp/AsnC family transcriptional regulator [Streptomyces inhibens]|nr:Lrp/AsnC family transcriptional regulator [Streptomyces inhibens]UKY53988.1 Lrp/AsnC family transcriptional regulator [Streptomyces inhibens]